MRPFIYRLTITRDQAGEVRLHEQCDREPSDCPFLWEYLRDLSGRVKPPEAESPPEPTETAD